MVTADLVAPAGNVSKRQCSLRVDGDVLCVRDAGGCGTYVNGQRIRGDTVLAPGDRIYFGNFTLQAELMEPSAATPGAMPLLGVLERAAQGDPQAAGEALARGREAGQCHVARLASLLAAPPGPVTWSNLVATLARWPDAVTREGAFRWARVVVERWPQDIVASLHVWRDPARPDGGPGQYLELLRVGAPSRG